MSTPQHAAKAQDRDGPARHAGVGARACYGTLMADRTFSVQLYSMRHGALALLVLASLATTACSGDRGRYPSLARRPAERAYGSAMPVTAPTPESQAPIAPDAGTAARVAALTDQAVKADAKFEARRASAERAVAAARGAAVGSEAWSVAQIAIADLDSARSEGMVAMADLDRMLVVAAQAAVDGPRADLDLIAPAHAQVDELMRKELATLDSLKSRVAG